MTTKKHPKDEMLINLGIIIRRMRLSKGFKSAELFSYENNLNRTAYWRWENGQNMTMKNFFKICSIHEMTPQEIFEQMDRKYKGPAKLSLASEPSIGQKRKDSDPDKYDDPATNDY